MDTQTTTPPAGVTLAPFGFYLLGQPAVFTPHDKENDPPHESKIRIGDLGTEWLYESIQPLLRRMADITDGHVRACFRIPGDSVGALYALHHAWIRSHGVEAFNHFTSLIADYGDRETIPKLCALGYDVFDLIGAGIAKDISKHEPLPKEDE